MNKFIQLLIKTGVTKIDVYEYDPWAFTAYGLIQTGLHSKKSIALFFLIRPWQLHIARRNDGRDGMFINQLVYRVL